MTKSLLRRKQFEILSTQFPQNGLYYQLILRGHDFTLALCTVLKLTSGGRGGSIGRVSASRSNGLYDQRFESRPEHKKNL